MKLPRNQSRTVCEHVNAIQRIVGMAVIAIVCLDGERDQPHLIVQADTEYDLADTLRAIDWEFFASQLK